MNLKHTLSRLSVSLALTLALSFAVSYGVKLLFVKLAPDVAATPLFAMLAGSLPIYLVGIPAGFLVLRGLPTGESRGEPLPPSMLFAMLPVTFGLMYLGSFLGNGAAAVVKAVTGLSYPNTTSQLILSSDVLPVLCIVSTAAPVMEELLFRKFLTDRLLPYGDAVAILYPAVLFGLFHGNFYQVFFAAFIGVLFGYLYVRTGKLRYPILLHVTVNLVGSVLLPTLLQATELKTLATAPLTAGDLVSAVAAHPVAFSLLGLWAVLVPLCMLTAVIVTAIAIPRILRTLRHGVPHDGFWRELVRAPGTWLLALAVLADFSYPLVAEWLSLIRTA